MKKKTIELILITLLGVTCAFSILGCSNNTITKNDSEVIGIIGAMDVEVESLKESIKVDSITTKAGAEYYDGTLGNMHVVIVKCDMGKVNAGICVNTLINGYGCSKIINTGVAGALDDTLRMGDIVISTDAVQHDFDATPIGYRKGEIPYTGKIAFEADEELIDRAYESAKEYYNDRKVYKGRICTGDQFIATKKEREMIVSNFGGLCCDMESAAIAQVCYLNDIPFVILRVVSDSPGETEIEEYQASESDYSLSCANIVKYMMEKYY